MSEDTCVRCNGTGKNSGGRRCGRCGGDGREVRPRTITNIGEANGRVVVWLGDDRERWAESILLDREYALNIARAILDVAVKPVPLALGGSQAKGSE